MAGLKSTYFDSCSTNEERLRKLPPDVTKDDWTWLVNWFSSEEFKVNTMLLCSVILNFDQYGALLTRNYVQRG
jgi:hypothetical protein